MATEKSGLNVNAGVQSGAESEYAIEIKDLYKAYGEKKVLKGLNLQIKKGELFGFIGKNGIGKSTTIDCMIGAKKFDKGTIYLDGFDITLEPLDAKATFGYVASEPSCYDVMTGYDFLEFIASIYKVSEGDFVRNYRYLCERLKLSLSELDNRIANYSHGMKQKVAIIGALVHKPKLLVLDEPFVGLDPKASAVLKAAMRELCEEGSAVFFSTHVLEVAERLCDKIAMINHGNIVVHGKVEELTREKTLEEVFLEKLEELPHA